MAKTKVKCDDVTNSNNEVKKANLNIKFASLFIIRHRCTVVPKMLRMSVTIA